MSTFQQFANGGKSITTTANEQLAIEVADCIKQKILQALNRRSDAGFTLRPYANEYATSAVTNESRSNLADALAKQIADTAFAIPNNSQPPVKLTLRRKSSTNEWVVRTHIGGRHCPTNDYFTDNKQDAIDTLHAIRQEYQSLGNSVTVPEGL